MKDSIHHRVIMSKRVAAKYIDSVAEVGRTLTVYFSDDRVMRSFVKDVKVASYGSSVSVTEGFDHATFMSTDQDAIHNVVSKADKLGLESTEM